MIITDRFVFLHLPKTGGTFVTEVLKKINFQYPELKVKEYKHLKHEGVKSIPIEAVGLPVVTTVRPPHEHYISRYEFRWWRRPGKKEFNPDLLHKRFPRFPDLNFTDFLRYRSDWDLVPLVRVKDITRRKKLRDILNENRIGFNSFEFFDLISRNSFDIFRDIDTLNESEIEHLKGGITFLFQPSLSKDLFNLLIHFDIPEDIASISLKSGRIKPKFQGANAISIPPHEYYSRKTDVEFVLDRDRLIFKLFDYLKERVVSAY